MSVNIKPIETKIFRRGDNLTTFLLESIPSSLLKDRMILAITSKIVSIAEGRLVPIQGTEKKELVRAESEHFLGEIGCGVSLGIKQGLLLPAAGIDESNSETGEYILHPADPFLSATRIRQQLQKELGLKELGIILTDSRSNPLRLGVTGVALSFSGFNPLKNNVGVADLFHRPLRMTQVNIVDSLAAIAVLTMGEASEQRPLAMIQGAEVEFWPQDKSYEFIVAPENDMYLPLYKHLLR